MSVTQKTLAPYRTWKVKPYSLSLETRLARDRAEQAQPPMISLHTSKQAKKADEATT
ncbi:MAG TPA: hypothetical protein VL003_00205 [Pusillimonas sp.]|uniref:hypothetical protein n=1 Tax=Pusillimonas sp. TaxID=3040095 RepID=UPI002C498F4E|nr:hypothetical protein [Pusillimonas sp.]HUH86458.1 hypothetical protein [Pusillimonas sp.]